MPDRFADGDASNDNLRQMPGTFDRSNDRAYHGGDLRGVEQHLDYIQQLGANTIWLTPIVANDNETPQNYHGYAAVNLYQVNPHFGSLQDFTDLAGEVHKRNMKLVLDMVPNHVGPKHPWVQDPPEPDWLHGTLDNHLRAKGKFAAITNPHAPPSAYREDLEGWFNDRLADLNQSNPKVKQYLIQNAIWWIETGKLDGLRLDTFAFADRSFWSDFHSALHALYPNLTTVGEIFNPDPTIVSYFAGGATHAGIDTGLYTPFDFPTYSSLRATLAGNAPMTQLAEIERQDWIYPHPERLVTFLGNHDTGRFASEPGANPARMKLAFGLLATMRGMPQIYSGDEIAMTGDKDANRMDFPGGFPGDMQNAFTVSGRTPEQEAMHAWVQGLLALRANHTSIQEGDQQNLLVDDAGFVFTRHIAGSNGERLLMLLNKSAKARTFHLGFEGTALDGTRALTPLWNSLDETLVRENACEISVGPESFIVLQAQR
jgi:glycosidase